MFTDMPVLQFINGAVVLVGIPTIISVLISIGRKLQILETLQTDVTKIKHNVSVVTTYLIKTQTDFDHKELQTMSPLGLTVEGTAFIKTLGFEEIFNAHRTEFFTFIDEDRPKLKYDVEAAAIKSIYALSEHDFMSPLKIFLYNTPSRTLENIAPTLGIYVRDHYLLAHPEITQ